MELTETDVRALSGASSNRLDLWASFLNATKVQRLVEIGVYRGEFAARMFTECPSIQRYYLLDPWRHLTGWNKPANKDDERFEAFYQEVLAKTSDFADRRVILRGRTTEVIDEIPDGELDFAYVDGDHTLRGITVDLVRVYPKLRDGGWLAGDDFCKSIFQHSDDYEPTLVFPFAVHFAEAMGARIYALPHSQFVIEKSAGGSFSFVDLTGRYAGGLTLKAQLDSRRARASSPGTVSAPPAKHSLAARTAARLRLPSAGTRRPLNGSRPS